MMVCPACKKGDTTVVDSRPLGQGDIVRRRRECFECRHRFTTYEQYAQEGSKLVANERAHVQQSMQRILGELRSLAGSIEILKGQLDKPM